MRILPTAAMYSELKVASRASTTTIAASTSKSSTSSAVSSWSCRPPVSRLMSGSGAAGMPPGAARAGGLSGAPCCAASPRLRNGSLRANLNAMRFSLVFLAQELALASDDGEVDELRPGVVLRRITHVEAADVDVPHPLDSADEPCAGQLLASALEPLDKDLGHDEALDRTEIEIGVARLGREPLVLLDDRHRRPPWERHDLGDRDAHAVAAERVGQRLAADERDVVERRRAAAPLHLPDKFRARGVLADHHHGVG